MSNPFIILRKKSAAQWYLEARNANAARHTVYYDAEHDAFITDNALRAEWLKYGRDDADSFSQFRFLCMSENGGTLREMRIDCDGLAEKLCAAFPALFKNPAAVSARLYFYDVAIPAAISALNYAMWKAENYDACETCEAALEAIDFYTRGEKALYANI